MICLRFRGDLKDVEDHIKITPAVPSDKPSTANQDKITPAVTSDKPSTDNQDKITPVVPSDQFKVPETIGLAEQQGIGYYCVFSESD